MASGQVFGMTHIVGVLSVGRQAGLVGMPDQ